MGAYIYILLVREQPTGIAANALGVMKDQSCPIVCLIVPLITWHAHGQILKNDFRTKK